MNIHRGTLVVVSCVAFSIATAFADSGTPPGGMHGPLEERMFKESDANGDGAISLSEFNIFQARQFKRMDNDGDGKITHEEMEAGHKKKKMGSGTTHLEQRFIAADANQDSGLDRTEARMMPMLTMYFDEVDANKDGKVTQQEYFDAMPLLHRGTVMPQDGKPESL